MRVFTIPSIRPNWMSPWCQGRSNHHICFLFGISLLRLAFRVICPLYWADRWVCMLFPHCFSGFSVRTRSIASVTSLGNSFIISLNNPGVIWPGSEDFLTFIRLTVVWMARFVNSRILPHLFVFLPKCLVRVLGIESWQLLLAYLHQDILLGVCLAFYMLFYNPFPIRFYLCYPHIGLVRPLFWLSRFRLLILLFWYSSAVLSVLVLHLRVCFFCFLWLIFFLQLGMLFFCDFIVPPVDGTLVTFHTGFSKSCPLHLLRIFILGFSKFIPSLVHL